MGRGFAHALFDHDFRFPSLTFTEFALYLLVLLLFILPPVLCVCNPMLPCGSTYHQFIYLSV